MQRIFLVSLLFSWGIHSPAQTVTDAQAYPGTDGTTVYHLDAPGSGSIIGGSFSNALFLEDTTLISRGEEDLFVIYERPGQADLVLLFGGSPLEERLDGLVTAGDSAVYLSGSFWQTAVFGSDTLRAQLNPKAMFVMRRNLQGQLDWVHTLVGGRLKEAGTMSLMPGGDLLVSGFFSDSLQVADTTLYSNAETNGFALRFTPGGDLQWAQTFGGKGNVRATHIACGPTSDAIYLSGFYDEELHVNDTILFANTTDRDVFLLRLQANGQIEWVEKAGGVFDEEPTALTVDAAGHPLLTGYLVGRMTLNGSMDIESADGNDDFFALRYRPDGRIHWAYALGGDQLQSTTAVAAAGDRLYLAGRFQSDLTFGPFDQPAGGLFDAFLLTMDTTGQFLDLWTASSGDALLPEALHVSSEGNLLLGGTYRGTTRFAKTGMGLELPTRDLFTGFRLKLDTDPVTSVYPSVQLSPLTLYPNPVHDRFRVKGLSPKAAVSVVDELGRIQHTFAPGTNVFGVTHLTSGRYYLLVQEGQVRRAIPFVKAR